MPETVPMPARATARETMLNMLPSVRPASMHATNSCLCQVSPPLLDWTSFGGIAPGGLEATKTSGESGNVFGTLHLNRLTPGLHPCVLYRAPLRVRFRNMCGDALAQAASPSRGAHKITQHIPNKRCRRTSVATRAVTKTKSRATRIPKYGLCSPSVLDGCRPPSFSAEADATSETIFGNAISGIGGSLCRRPLGNKGRPGTTCDISGAS